MKTGSQDISPPKDTEDAAQPAEDLKTNSLLSSHPAGPAPEEAQPGPMTGPAVSSEETAAELATEVRMHRLISSLALEMAF